MNRAKVKKCSICRAQFVPRDSIQVVCSYDCALRKLQKDKEKKVKELKRQNREKKESLRTRKYYVRKLQELVNKWVRLRDEGKDCISCDVILNSSIKKFDAGHYFSAGHYPELRFNLDNIFGQCVECNRHKRGNLIEYRPKLIERIGEERFQQLADQRNIKSDLTKEDLKDLILLFRNKIKKKENEIRSDNN